MGQRGARGQSLRASWQWQHQCQTLEEERTCMMVSPEVWKHASMASLLGLGSFSHFKPGTEWPNQCSTNGLDMRKVHRNKTRGWIEAIDIASDLFRPDKVSKSLIAHFWGSKLLMITVRLSAQHSTSRTSACRQGYKSKRQRGEKRRLMHRLGALYIMVYMRHQWLEKQQIKPRVEDTSTVMLNVLGLKCEQAT